MSLNIRETSKDRKLKSSVYKKRNREFGELASVKSIFCDNDKVLEFIFKARSRNLKEGCKNCGNPLAFYQKIPGKLAYKCKCNKSQVIYPLKGTPLEHCKKPLTLIIEIIYEMFCSKHGFTATQIDRKFDVRKNETSHFLLNRISQWFGLAIFGTEFSDDSIIEVDEVYPYAKTGLGSLYSFKKGLGSERLQKVIVFVERSGLAKAIAVDETNTETIKELFRKYTKPSNIIYTDESKLYNFLGADGEFSDYSRFKCNHSKKEWVVDGSNTNTVEGYNSYVKKYIHAIHLGVSRPKIQLYLNRISFNFSYSNKNIYEVLEILFNSLPQIGESIENRVTCRRTEKLWSKAA